MVPTLRPNQCFTSRFLHGDISDVTHGTIITFFGRPGKTLFFFRVIGMPGDTVQMRNGKIWLNGQEVKQTREADDIVKMEAFGPLKLFPRCNSPTRLGGRCIRYKYRETLPNGVSYSVLDIGSTPMDETKEFLVPEGTVFVLGDNRDNAIDSRYSRFYGGRGFVAFEDIQGIVER